MKAMEKHPDDRYQDAAEIGGRSQAGPRRAGAPGSARQRGGHSHPHLHPAAARLRRRLRRAPHHDAPTCPGRRAGRGPADRSTIVIGVLAAVGLLGLGLMLLVKLFGSSTPEGTVTVPEVRGMEFAVARTTLDDAGLVRVGEEVVADPEVPRVSPSARRRPPARPWIAAAR